jgi:uncharacterized protein (DUF4415 family)
MARPCNGRGTLEKRSKTSQSTQSVLNSPNWRLTIPLRSRFAILFHARKDGAPWVRRAPMESWSSTSSTLGRRVKMKKVESSAHAARRAKSGKLMRKGNPRPLSRKLRAEARALAAMPENAIDTIEMPEIADWSNAARGALYRPVKRPLSLRLDADVVDWFQKQGSGYQTRMNLALREYVDRKRKRA